MTASVIPIREVRRGRLSACDVDRAIQMFESGMSVGVIALRLNRHRSTINGIVSRHSLRPPVRQQIEFVRGGVVVSPFDREEDAFISALRTQGYSLSFIATMCGKRYGRKRSTSSISTRLMMLAARESEAV